jgi:hypothetical protein
MAVSATARAAAASGARRRAATARRAAAARKPAPRRTAAAPSPARPARRTSKTGATRRSQITPIPGRLVAVGVGRTAGAVGGLADSGLMVRLTRGRLWIGVLATLLVGIVALNVTALGFNASSSKVGRATDELRRANLALHARIAGELSIPEVQAAAADLGLAMPSTDAIRYVHTDPEQAAVAARRLASGELVALP